MSKPPKDDESSGRESRIFKNRQDSELTTLFQSLIENAFDVIEVVDTETNTLYISPSCKHILGVEPDDVIGSKGMTNVHPDDREKAWQFVDMLTNNPGSRGEVELRAYRRDGSLRVIELVGMTLPSPPFVDEIVLNYHDVTKQRRTQDALRASEERFYKAFHSCPSSITISQFEDGVIVEANAGFEKLSGYKRDEIVGKSSFDLNLWKDPTQRNDIVERLKTAGTIRDYKAEFLVKNGETRICKFSADIIEIEGKMFTLAVTSDITDWVRAETQLRQTARELRQERETLMKKNIALEEILDHIEKEKIDYRHDLSARVENLFAPLIARLKETDGQLPASDIQRLDEALKTIIDEDLSTFENNLAKLTPRELDVCEGIKKGLSSKEMADELGLSIQTVHKHRRTIRRKLQLTNKDINLAAFLRSKERPS